MYKYKTKDGTDVVIPNIGVTKNGIIETEEKLESPILEEISQSNTDQSAPVATQAAMVSASSQPAAQPAAPVETNSNKEETA